MKGDASRLIWWRGRLRRAGVGGALRSMKVLSFNMSHVHMWGGRRPAGWLQSAKKKGNEVTSVTRWV